MVNKQACELWLNIAITLGVSIENILKWDIYDKHNQKF